MLSLHLSLPKCRREAGEVTQALNPSFGRGEETLLCLPAQPQSERQGCYSPLVRAQSTLHNVHTTTTLLLAY